MPAITAIVSRTPRCTPSQPAASPASGMVPKLTRADADVVRASSWGGV